MLTISSNKICTDLASLETRHTQPQAECVPIVTRDQIINAAFKKLAQNKLLWFTKWTMPNYKENWHHKLLCDTLDRFVAGDIKRLIVSMPPQHGKSELVSRRLPAYLLGKHPNVKIISASYNATLAKSFCRDVKKIISDDLYKQLFNIKLPTLKDNEQNSAETFELVGDTGSYYCAGVGGGISGKSLNYGICDDLMKGHADAWSPTKRDRVFEWYMSEFASRQNPWSKTGGADRDELPRTLVMGTRWHKDDLTGRLLDIADKHGEADQWHVLSLPAIKEHEGHDDDPRVIGEALWPEFMSKEKLRQAEVSSPTAFAALYQQNPKLAGGSEWHPELFTSDIYWDGDWSKIGISSSKVVTLDPSLGGGTSRSDYSAFIKLAVGRDGLHYVEADMRNDRNAIKMIETIISINEQWHPNYFGIENVAFQGLLGPLCEEYCKNNNHVLPPLGYVKADGNKNVRIRRLGPLIANKQLKIKDNQSGRLLVEQLEQWPNCNHDDGPDSLEMALRLLREMDEIQIEDDGLGNNLFN